MSHFLTAAAAVGGCLIGAVAVVFVAERLLSKLGAHDDIDPEDTIW